MWKKWWQWCKCWFTTPRSLLCCVIFTDESHYAPQSHTVTLHNASCSYGERVAHSSIRCESTTRGVQTCFQVINWISSLYRLQSLHGCKELAWVGKNPGQRQKLSDSLMSVYQKTQLHTAQNAAHCTNTQMQGGRDMESGRKQDWKAGWWWYR